MTADQFPFGSGKDVGVIGGLGNQVYHFIMKANKLYNSTDCSVEDFSQCLVEFPAAGKSDFYCPVKCGDNVVHMYLDSRSQPIVQFEYVSQAPTEDYFNRVAIEYLQDLIDTSGVNTFAFLKGVEGFEGRAEDVKVSGGNFVELPLGFQYCIEVYSDAGEERKSTVLDIYQFKLPNTEPFLVFHPYSGPRTMEECTYFMLKVDSMWGN